MFDMYIKKAESISKLAKKDKNITRHLSRDAQELIRANKDLAAQGLIDEVFNVGLMDKMNPKDLKELLTRYQVSVKLYQTQVFRTPNETKKRTRTPKTK